jgi:hypothetical protein
VYTLEAAAVVAPGSAPQQNVMSQWQLWQLVVLHAMQPLMSAMTTLGMLEQAGDAEDRAAAAAAAGPDETNGNSSSGQASSSSSSQQKWGHLLHLQQFSPDWAAAVEAFTKTWPGCWGQVEDMFRLIVAGTIPGVEELPLLFDDAFQLVKELVDAAPLPVVCTNPGCESLAGLSEAAAACKACSRCMCRYCSVAFQRADWKRHKPACKRMAAAGMTCV